MNASLIKTSVLAAAIALIAAACGTLSESRLDQTLRARGTFLCPAKKIKLPAGTSDTSLQARCYRDSVEIEESQAEWNRVYFSLKDCTGEVVGKASWNAKLVQEDPTGIAVMKPSNDRAQFSTRYGAVTNRHFTRTSAEWFAEGLAGCDLRNVAVDHPITIGFDSPCASLLPKVEPEEQKNLVFISNAHDGAHELHGFWDGEAAVCIR